MIARSNQAQARSVAVAQEVPSRIKDLGAIRRMAARAGVAVASMLMTAGTVAAGAGTAQAVQTTSESSACLLTIPSNGKFLVPISESKPFTVIVATASTNSNGINQTEVTFNGKKITEYIDGKLTGTRPPMPDNQLTIYLSDAKVFYIGVSNAVLSLKQMVSYKDIRVLLAGKQANLEERWPTPSSPVTLESCLVNKLSGFQGSDVQVSIVSLTPNVTES